MIMIPGTGTISNYGSYISNCQKGQMPYKIPVNSLADVQLYINIGAIEPSAVQYQLINTCGPGGVQTITTASYVVGQDTNGNWYGVFKNFTGATPVCFVIGITLTISGVDRIFFSEEYCIENSCNTLTLLKGCYGNLDNRISYDCEEIYFGTTDSPDAMGDVTIVYKHELFLRDVEVTLNAIKHTFKQGRTRNFRTEKQKTFQFWSETIPEWYVSEIDAIFYRGEVYVGGVKYTVNDTAFELVEGCKKIWMPTATFKENCYQSFSCEINPCASAPEECCDPMSVSASVVTSDGEIQCCDPEIISADVFEQSGG